MSQYLIEKYKNLIELGKKILPESSILEFIAKTEEHCKKCYLNEKDTVCEVEIKTYCWYSDEVNIKLEQYEYI